MIKKVKASLHEKLIFIFLILLGVFALGFTVVIKNKCLFIKNYLADLHKLSPQFEGLLLNLEQL